MAAEQTPVETVAIRDQVEVLGWIHAAFPAPEIARHLDGVMESGPGSGSGMEEVRCRCLYIFFEIEAVFEVGGG